MNPSLEPVAAPAERLLKLAEAAGYLRFHPRTVLEFVKAGELRGRKIGGRWRFHPQDLRRFFEGPTIGAESLSDREGAE